MTNPRTALLVGIVLGFLMCACVVWIVLALRHWRRWRKEQAYWEGYELPRDPLRRAIHMQRYYDLAQAIQRPFPPPPPDDCAT